MRWVGAYRGLFFRCNHLDLRHRSMLEIGTKEISQTPTTCESCVHRYLSLRLCSLRSPARSSTERVLVVTPYTALRENPACSPLRTLVTGFFWHPGADTWLPSPSPASRPYASSHGHFSNFNCCICNVDDWVALLCPAQPLHPQYKGKSSKQANLDVSCEGAALLRAAPSHWTRRERFKEGK